jgi:hypothetical protein
VNENKNWPNDQREVYSKTDKTSTDSNTYAAARETGSGGKGNLMKHARNLILAGVLGLSGCASLFEPPVHVGDTETQTIARLGPPTAVYPDGNSKLLSYRPGYFSQYSYMARIGPDGRLVSYEQVWTMEKFAMIKPNVSTREDVLRTVGAPTEIVGYARSPYAAWNYGFREAGVWNSMMTIYLDSNGIVRKLENGPDLRYDADRFGFR